MKKNGHNKTKKCVAILILTIILLLVFQKHGFSQYLGYFNISSICFYDFENKKGNLGLDCNVCNSYINGGVSYKLFLNQKSAQQHEMGFYLGLGAANYFQVQLGYTNSGIFMLRERSDFYLLGIKKQAGKTHLAISLSVILEQSLTSSERGWLFGIGLGILIY